MVLSLFLYVILFYGLLAHAQSLIQLPFIPLAVKTPYLNAWSLNSAAPPTGWSQFFTNDKIVGWMCMVRVDGQAYQWMGAGYPFSTTVMSTITPTQTVFRIEAGPVQFNATFLSPIEPKDYVRQSTPFTYMYVDGFSSNDSAPHTVQLYSDITAEWVARDVSVLVQWDTLEEDTMIYHQVRRQVPEPGIDNNNFAEDATSYFAAPMRSGLTWRTGSAAVCRSLFITNGTLSNTKDANFRAINADGWPAFAYAVDLGVISPGSQPDPVVWTIGLVRDPLLTYPALSQNRTAFYWSQFSNISSVISAFLADFNDARQRNLGLDTQIMSAASNVSPEYTDIVSLVTRQLFASMDITIPKAQDGSLNTSDVKIFMKDMGASKRVNPVDVIYAAFPALVYFNATFARDLLVPLLDLQISSPYAAPDLGNGYPAILGNNTDTHLLAVDNCGSMLIMAYAHAVKSGDGSLLSRYYPTLQLWADFLVANSLDPPPGSMTMDGLPAVGMSNVALKGILGIWSMGKINEALGSSNTSYMDYATQFSQNWTQSAVSSTHIKSAFEQPSSWGLMYNLYPAIWLGTNMINNDTLSSQATFYVQQNGIDIGLGLDSSNENVIYPHWTLLTAATIPDDLASFRSRLIQPIHNRSFNVSAGFPQPMTYAASTGSVISGASGSAIFGAAYGLLTLSLPNVPIQADSLPSSSTNPKVSNPKQVSKTAAIVGGVIGGIAVIILVVFVLLFWRRRRTLLEEKGFKERPDPFSPLLPNSTPLALPSSSGHAKIKVTPISLTAPSLSSLTHVGSAEPPTSNKQREAYGSLIHRPMPSDSAVTNTSNKHSAPTSATNDLRVQVADLRRELESMRHLTDMPPLYT